MAKSRTIISQTNNIVYVEPNYNSSVNGYDEGGLETFEMTPDLEDYSIFVNLEIETIGRTIQTGNKVYKFSYISKGGNESVNLMGGTKITTTDGGSINSLTTNWTDTHISDIKGAGASAELFGINYIDIAYNHFMVPEVTIEFVDIRGASVFAQKEAFETNNAEMAIGGNYDGNIVNTFFQCFFTFPYPKFTLFVKGFYGQPVAYELTCADFRARFNSDTGNFSCTAKFVGYQFSFLNDVMLNALVAAPYSDFLGAAYWHEKNFTIPGYNGGEKAIPKIGELLKQMKQAETAAEQISQSSPEMQEKNNVEHITQKYNNIKSLYENYVSKINELVKNKNLSDDADLFITDLADYKIGEGAIVIVENDAKESFAEHFDDKDGTVNGAYESLIAEIKTFNEEFVNANLPNPKNFAEAMPTQRIQEDDKHQGQLVIDKNNINDDIKEQTPFLYNAFESNVLRQNYKGDVNKYSKTKLAYYYYDGGFSSTLNKAIKDATDKERDLSSKIASNKADALAQRLGFKPTVENVTKIMMAHFETFAHMIYQTGLLIENEKPKRDTNKLGITDDDDVADVPEIYRSDEGYLIVPPFPKVTKIVEKNGLKNREESWVGDYGNVFRETDLVHGILNGIDEFVKTVQAGETNGAAGSTSSVKAIMAHPLSPLDFILTNNVYSDFSQNEPTSLLSLVALRALQILGLTNIKGWDKDCEALGRAEAENLIKSEKISNGLKDLLKPLSNELGNVLLMLNGFEGGTIQKPSDGIWPWQNSKDSVGILSNSEFNICKIDTNNGKTVYALPIQDLSWKKIKDEILKSNVASSSEDYFNVSQTVITNRHKDNCFNIETNINRIKNICEAQMDGIDSENYYKAKILDEATYDSRKYKDYCSNYKSLIAYPIKDAAKLMPTDKSCMLPCTTNYLKSMSWGGGYNMNNFIKENLGGGWRDKDGNFVTRTKDDGYEDFFTELNTNNFTITEIPGLDTSLKPNKDVSLFTQLLYYNQKDDRAKGFMLLCSLGYLYDYVKIFEDELCNKDKTISIIPLPAVLFAGGIVWATRRENKVNKFVGCSAKSETIEDCSELLWKLDGQVLLKLEKEFLDWIDKGVQNNSLIVSFKELKSNMEFTLNKASQGRTYDNFFCSLGEIEKDSWFFGKDRTWFKEGVFRGANDGKSYEGILELFVGEVGENFFRNYICIDEDLGGSTTDKTIGIRVGNRDGSPGVKQFVDFGLAPCLFMKSSKFFFLDEPKKIKVEEGKLKAFFKGFLERVTEDVNEETMDNSVSQAKKTETTTDIKVGVYRYCKLLYDKWIGGMSDTDFENFTMHKFFESDDKYFHFIDAYYNYANDIPVNIGDFCDKIVESYMNADYSLLAFLSSIYSQNKFNFICVQNFLDLSDKDNMIRMFDCVPYTDSWEVNRHPNFIVNYAYEASSHLDIKNAEYENDGFMINMPESSRNKWPEALKSRNAGSTSGLNIPAFGVSYGKMYQSYFKDINISMDNPTVTEQSIKAQFAIACQNNENSSQGDESKEYTYGQDLYSVYSNNSYECEVIMMGCAWVQPLMLFVLNNVPMFRGTYQIINVTHHIEQGDMVTKFRGVRMANVTTRIVEETSVSRVNDGTFGGINTEVNKSAFASTDNDCPYEEFPLSIGGSAGGGIPQSFLNMKFGDFSGNGNINKWVQEGTPLSTGITADMTIGQVLCAAIAAEYRGFTQNNSLMLRVAAAMVCNKYHWCKANNKWIYLFGTKQQGTGNKAANLDLANKYEKLVMPVFVNGPGSLVGEIAKVQDGCNVEIWNKGKTEHKKAPNTHVITEDDMRRVFAYCTMGGYDYEHIGSKGKCGKQTNFENKSNPNNGDSLWKKADFLFQEYNSVFTSSPDSPSKTFWEPAPPIVNNGKDDVSEFANGFLHALNQTSQSSSVKVSIGIEKTKSKGDTIYLTNAHNDTNFGKVLDMMLQAYSGIIEKIYWYVPGENGNQSLPPAGYLVFLKKGSTQTQIQVIDEKTNKQVPAISFADEGGMNSDFRKAIVKKYSANEVVTHVFPSTGIEAIYPDVKNSIADCDSVMSPSSNTTAVDGPFTSSNWDVNAFVKNLHYWQQNVCRARGKTPSAKGSCGSCTGAINRALESTGLGRKYWRVYPWEVCSAMSVQGSEFTEIDSGTTSNKQEFGFKYNPMAGDICTMWSTPNKNIHFHTCAFDGSKWISDFVQNNCNVYRSASPCTMEYHVFRHK